MKIKVKVVNCIHETQYGSDHYIGVIKKNETAKDVADRIKKECDYGNYHGDEFFDTTLQELVLDTDDFEELET